jgi:HEAT repeat protein
MRVHGTPEDWLAWLTGVDARKRKEATLIMGGLRPGDVKRIAPLVDGLASPDGDIVFWCAVGLKRLGEQAALAIPELARIAVGYEQFGVRQAAVAALSKIGPRDRTSKAAVLRGLEDPNPFVRREALEALIGFETLSDEDIGRIKAMERDADEHVASWSEIALRNIRLKGRRDV